MLNIAAHTLNAASSTGGSGNSLIFLILMVVAIIFLFIMPARRQRKMQAQLKERQDSMVPGTDVMTNFGLFGTVVEVNNDENFAILEVSPGNRVKVHLQTVTTVLTDEKREQTEESASQPEMASEEVIKDSDDYRYRRQDKED